MARCVRAAWFQTRGTAGLRPEVSCPGIALAKNFIVAQEISEELFVNFAGFGVKTAGFGVACRRAEHQYAVGELFAEA